MKNPQGCNKTTLLAVADELNEMGAKLRVKSKSVVLIVEAVSLAIAELNHTEMLEHLSETALAELTAWGIMEDFYLDPESMPDGLVKTLMAIEDAPDDFVQAESAITCEDKLPAGPEWEKWELALEDDDLSKKQIKKLNKKIKAAKEEHAKVEAEQAEKKAARDAEKETEAPAHTEMDALIAKREAIEATLDGLKKKKMKKVLYL